MATSDAPRARFKFDSPEGRKICRVLARPDLKYDPHDYSLDVTVKIIDGVDCLVRAACGSGKTVIMAMLAIVLKKFGADPTLYSANPVRTLVPDPAILVICPTNALERDLVSHTFYGITGRLPVTSRDAEVSLNPR